MGSWRNRPPRRFFNRQRSPKSYPLDLNFSSPGFREDGVPFWEKKFCTLIGRVPWQKIVDTKKFMYGSNVLDWDDLAGKEAFQNAKNRFWAEINSLPCDISLPDPDIYIDEINWNPDIDLELIRDLDSAYFAPEEGENDGKFGRGHKNYRDFTNDFPKGCSENSGINNNPWEGNDNMQGSGAFNDGAQGGWNHLDPWEANDNMQCSGAFNDGAQGGWNQPDPWEGNDNLQGSGAFNDGAQGGWNQSDNGNKDSENLKTDDNPWESTCTWGNEVVQNKVAQGWNQWDDNNNVSEKLNNDNNPWKSSLTWGDEAVRDNAWGSCDDKLWGSNQGSNHASRFRKWDNGGKHWDGRAGSGNNSSYWSQQRSWKFDGGDNPVAHNYIQHSKTHQDRGWRDCSRGNAWGYKQRDSSYNDPRNSECGLSGGGWRTWNENGRKREGSHLTSYKSSGYQRDHNQTGHSWRAKNANKRVSFAL